MIKLLIEFEISEEAYELLKRLDKGHAEYRDSEYATVEQFKKSSLFEHLNEEEAIKLFLDRNTGGTYYLIPELEMNGLVEMDTDCWHETYVITDLGKRILHKVEILSTKSYDYMDCQKCGSTTGTCLVDGCESVKKGTITEYKILNKA